MIYAVALSLIFSLNAKAFSQESKSDSSTIVKNYLQPNMWAFEFGISSNFTLTSFQGTVLSIKRQLNSHEAIQLGIGGSLSNQNSSSSGQNEWGDTLTYGNSGSGTNTGGSVQVNLQYVYYFNPDADINVYVGAGPTVGYSRTIYNYNYTPVLPVPADSGVYINYPTNSNQSYTSWNAGVSGMLGAECFILKFLSIHAQYGLNVTYSESNTTYSYNYAYFYDVKLNKTSSSNQSKSHGWQLSPTSVMFGLSVYFK
jgi:hypothetical protein